MAAASAAAAVAAAVVPWRQRALQRQGVPLRGVRWPLRLALAVGLGLGELLPLALLQPAPLRAQPAAEPPMRATVQEILDRPELFIEARQARVQDVPAQPERISTRNSRAQLRCSSGAAGRLTRHSQLRLGTGCFLLEQGQVLVSGRQSACTRSLRLSVGGTNYILEHYDNGDAAVVSLQGVLAVELLEGDAGIGSDVGSAAGPAAGAGAPRSAPPLLVASGQRLRLLRRLGMTTLIALTPADYRAILEGPFFQGFQQRLPDQGALEDYLAASVPGVSLPRPAPPRATSTPGFSFGFGFGGFGGDQRGRHRGSGGDRQTPGHSIPRDTSPRYSTPR